MNFCETCNKIVPDNEIAHYEPNAFCDHETHFHQYETYVNANGFSTGFNFCGISETQYCGNIREPSPEEYFAYITCSVRK